MNIKRFVEQAITAVKALGKKVCVKS